jgi:YVTN family beta-propeller protein
MARFSVSARGVAALVVVATLACAFATSASASPLLYTLNSGTSSVSTIDTATNQYVGTAIPTGAVPQSIAITPNGHKAFVANTGGDDVTVIETAMRTPVATIHLGAHAERIAISPDGSTAYVTVEDSEDIFIIDTATNEEVGSFAVGPEASALAFTPDGKQAYVGISPEDVQVMEGSRRIGAPLAVGGFPRAIAFTPNGETAYVAAGNKVSVINTALRQVVGEIPIGSEATNLAVTPTGGRLYATSKNGRDVTVVETATGHTVGTPIELSGEPEEIAITPDGNTAYVANGAEITPINLVTGKPGTPITASAVYQLVVAPDQSPMPVFTAPTVTAAVPAIFDGSASTDPDGTIVSYDWTFGDGTAASGAAVTHTYTKTGSYEAQLKVLDNEGCGEKQVFTGRTAYCSGSPEAIHRLAVGAACSTKFKFGRLIHNRKNGTARLQVKLPAAGSVFLFGKKVHAVSRKAKKAGSMFLTIHARVELNKQLKKIHRKRVRIRVTYTPNAGCGYKTVHRSITLLHKKKRHHH